MSARKTKMTLDDHREMGLRLRVVDDELSGQYTKIRNSKSKSDPRANKVCRSLDKAIWSLRQTRSELENMMFVDYPGMRTDPSATLVYYPHRADA